MVTGGQPAWACSPEPALALPSVWPGPPCPLPPRGRSSQWALSFREDPVACAWAHVMETQGHVAGTCPPGAAR